MVRRTEGICPAAFSGLLLRLARPLQLLNPIVHPFLFLLLLCPPSIWGLILGTQTRPEPLLSPTSQFLESLSFVVPGVAGYYGNSTGPRWKRLFPIG